MTARTFGFSVSNVTALAAFGATLAPGEIRQYPMLSLNDNTRTGSYPWDAPAAAVAANIGAVKLLDWASMMDVDPVTKRWYISGGRPYQEPITTKMVIVDELANEVRSLDAWSGRECGHLYRSTTVIPEHRRVAYYAHGSDYISLLNIDTEQHAGDILGPPNTIGGFTNGWSGHHFICWHPGLGPQGSLVHANSSRDRVVRYDWATQVWLAVGNFDGLWVNRHMDGHMHPLTGKMILGSTEASVPKPLAILDATGAMTLTEVAPCTVASNSNAQFFPHPTRAASISFCHDTGRIWSYEWLDDLWIDRGAMPAVVNTPEVIVCPTGWGGLFFEYGSNGTTKAYGWRPNF